MSRQSSFADVWEVMCIACGRPLEARVTPSRAVAHCDRISLLRARQIHVVQLIADGRTPNLSLKTNNNHLTAIYRRLNTQNISQTLMQCVRLRLIDVE